MAIAFRDSAEAAVAGTGTPIEIIVPSTVQAGDGLLVATDLAADLAGPEDGWALREKIVTSDGTNTLHLWSKVATTLDAGSTLTLSDSSPVSKVAALLVAYAGTDDGDPIHALVPGSETASSTTHVTPTVTTTRDGCVIVEILGAKDSTSTALTPPSGFTLRRWTKTGGSGQRSVAVGDDFTAHPAGTYGGHTWTYDVTAGNVAMITIALAPAGETQTVRPDSDVTVTGWTGVPTPAAGVPLASYLADGSDVTYVDAAQGTPGTWRFSRLTNPGSGNGFTLRVRPRDPDATSVTRTVRLVQDSTTIAEFTDSTVLDAFTWQEYEVSAAQAAAIDYDQPVDVFYEAAP